LIIDNKQLPKERKAIKDSSPTQTANYRDEKRDIDSSA
jgi:hypothetical protein